MTSLAIDNVSVAFDGRTAVGNVTFEAEGGALIGLIGPNGAGKTSLLRAIANLVPYTGEVRLAGRNCATMGTLALAREIAYLAQDRSVHWPLSVAETVALGRLPHRAAFARASDADTGAIRRALAATGMEALSHRSMLELSGGEKARALLARALAVESPVLLVDEPIAALDPYHQLEIMELLRARAQAGALVITVLHDLTLAGRFCQRLLLMGEGALMMDGPPHEVLNDRVLEEAFHISVAHGEKEGASFAVPWRRTE